MNRYLLVVLLAGCARSSIPRPQPAPATTVATDAGMVIGQRRGGGREFLGIPYAAPPIGALRWRAPMPVAPWPEPRDATRRGNACIQLDDDQRAPESEDCLVLNLWAPATDGGPQPVMVWIHGGAFYQGSGGDDLYDGAALAARTGAIVVTINYRLGPLGFLSHRALARELDRPASPSFGLLDQRAALAWVQRNVAGFGGDPERVTVFGQSAGAWSVCAQLASPGSRGLFARAIMQSGACDDALYFDAAAAEAQGEAFAHALGCDDADPLVCLRAAPAAAVVAALPIKRGSILHPGVWWGPVVDGVELPVRPLAAMRAGTSAPVPLLIGANRDEGIIHTISFDQVTLADLEDFVGASFGAAAIAPVLARYQRPDAKAALDAIVTDGIFVCQARRIARALAARGVPVFQYHWTRALADPRVHELGATHSVELFFVFGNVSLGYGITDDERPLARTMMDAWGAFARTGDPSTPALAWPRYTADRDPHVILDLPAAVGTGLQAATCDFWDALVTD